MSSRRRYLQMKKVLLALAGLAFAASMSVAQDVVSFMHGTVKKVDKATKTVVVKTKDGTEHTVKVASDDTVKGTKDGFDGIKKGTVEKVDEGAKTVAVKSADGTEKTFEYTGNALKDSSQAVGKGTEKGAKITVYYTEETGKKIAHFFEF